MSITTIKLDHEIKERLDAFKVHPRETYNDIVKRMLECVRICKTAPEQARAPLIRLDRMRDSLSGKITRLTANPVSARSPNPPRNPRPSSAIR